MDCIVPGSIPRAVLAGAAAAAVVVLVGVWDVAVDPCWPC